ncbi:MAG: hypothetical protein ACOCRK_00800 [bacterium]
MYFNTFDNQILNNKKSKMMNDSYKDIYQVVMSEVIYNSIPEKQKEILNDIPARHIKYHIGEIVEEILPFDEYDDRVKQTNEYNAIFIRGIIEGLTEHYTKLIGEAKDEDETKKAPKEVKDVLGEMHTEDIEEEISQTIKREMKEDAAKVKEDKKKEKELEEEVEIDDEDSDDFEEEVDETETIGESTFDSIMALDPFNNKVVPDKDYISIIKERVIDIYSNVNGEEETIMGAAKLDTIVYVAIAVTLDRLNIMGKKEFLDRMDEMEDTPPEELEESFKKQEDEENIYGEAVYYNIDMKNKKVKIHVKEKNKEDIKSAYHDAYTKIENDNRLENYDFSRLEKGEIYYKNGHYHSDGSVGLISPIREQEEDSDYWGPKSYYGESALYSEEEIYGETIFTGELWDSLYKESPNLQNELHQLMSKHQTVLEKFIQTKGNRGDYIIGKNTGKKYLLKDDPDVDEPVYLVLTPPDIIVLKPLLKDIAEKAIELGKDPARAISVSLGYIARMASQNEKYTFYFKSSVDPNKVFRMIGVNPNK